MRDPLRMTDAVVALRAFNRFHTRFVGALDAQYLKSDMTLVEARLLYEIAQHDCALASDLQAVLGLDAGYLSRLLRKFEGKGWIARARGDDRRARPIALTPEGRAAFEALDAVTRADVETALAPLDATDRGRLVAALGTVQALLGGNRDRPWSIRTFRVGDMGMITARQAILYAEGWGWGRGLEILEGEVTTAFLRDFKPGLEQCWVAEQDGRMAGSIFCCQAAPDTAQLRLLYVEPWARGLGIGEALVARCVGFARDAGYARMTLWTHSVLASARRIYDAAGFKLIATEMHDEFGEPVQGESWELVF